MLRLRSKVVAAAAACGVALEAHGALVWDEREAAFGDFADESERLTPTPVVFAPGDNTIIGTTGNPFDGTGVDRDYFTFTVPAGATLTAIVPLDNTLVSGSSSFIALQAGSQFTVNPNGQGGTMLGFLHYDVSHVGQNILPLLVQEGVLPSGAYSVWVQETGGTVEYGFDFHLTEPAAADVPIPAAVVWLLGGLLGLAGWRRLKADVRHA